MGSQTFVIELLQKIAIVNFLRYFIASGLAFLFFYILLKNKWKHKKIQLKFPANSDYRREIIYSLITLVIFTGIAMLVFASPLRENIHGVIRIYLSMVGCGGGLVLA